MSLGCGFPVISPGRTRHNAQKEAAVKERWRKLGRAFCEAARKDLGVSGGAIPQARSPRWLTHGRTGGGLVDVTDSFHEQTIDGTIGGADV